MCHKCESLQAELNGAREVIRAHGEFIQRLKKSISIFTNSDAQTHMSRKSTRLDK